MPPTRMTLSAAMTANGIEAVDRAYDRVRIEVAPRWMTKAWASGVRAMTVPRRIYVSGEAYADIAAGRAARLLRHEAVHVDQWRRHGAVGFLGKYLGGYLRGRAAGLPHAVAYRAIPFEREATSKSE